MQLSKYIMLAEFERSDYALRHGMKNKMGTTQTAYAKELCVHVLDKIRDYYKSPIIISSGFRCMSVNTAIGGVATSQHTKGQAADFTIVGKTVDQVFQDIRCGKIKGLAYDQLIWEFGLWIHISYVADQNRHQNLKAMRQAGRTVYIPVGLNQ